MKKRFLITLAYTVMLGLLIVSGSGCSGVAHSEGPTAVMSATGEFEYKSHITPDCPAVKQVLQDIVGEPPYEASRAGFDAIRDWVAANIHYSSDQERWGEDYWQTPEETLASHAGDCEDFSILLCSLLRAYGIDAQRVYVALGIDGTEDGHAFLIENWYDDGEWRRLESQAPAQLSSHSWLGPLKTHPDSRLDKYEITEVFNDLYYYEDDGETFPWSKDQASTSIVTKVISTAGDVARQLSPFIEYLLGLLFN
jgi:predicted transglutaminase-like cysteine proteinase